MLIEFFATTNELLMHASRDEFRLLATAVEQREKASLEGEQTFGESRGKNLKSIIVRAKTSEAVVISVTPQDEVLITGDKNNLGILADNLRGFADDAADGDHQHFEHFPEHSYIAAESIPTVIDFK